jgi:nucleoside phosphorylase
LLYDEAQKVRRWALNSLALVGGARDVEPILQTISKHRDDPDVLHAGVAALASITSREQLDRLLSEAELPLEVGLLLAVAQQSDMFTDELRLARINIEKSAPADLRMATILVGLGKAPSHLFSAAHGNDVMIGELNRHDDALVAQYSVWATVEHPLLNLKHLKLALRDIEAQPSNVRGWVYRLLSADAATAEKHIDILQTGAADASMEAREGLAAGLRTVFSPGVEKLVVDWFLREQSEPVRQRLLEHMAISGHSSWRYTELVLQIYEAAGERSLIRTRLEAAAQGTKLYTELKTISLDAERRDLFALEGGSDEGSPLIDGPSANSTSPASLSFVPPNMQDDHAVKESEFPDQGEVRILIVTALALESAAVLATLDRHKKFGVNGDTNVYHLGLLIDEAGGPPRAVIVCQAGMGKSNASTTAANALRSFPNVQHIVMTGIAGGCPNPDNPVEHVRLGDIVVSGPNGIIEYDYVKETADQRLIRAWPQRPSRALLQVLEALRTSAVLGDRPWLKAIDTATPAAAEFIRPNPDQDVLHDKDGALLAHPSDPQRDLSRPSLHVGVIATADTLQKDPEARDALRDKFGARAIEMEASGMQNAAWAAQKDVFVVRGICDYCDNFKDDAWHGFAAIAAAGFTRSLVEAMPEEWFPR